MITQNDLYNSFLIRQLYRDRNIIYVPDTVVLNYPTALGGFLESISTENKILNSCEALVNALRRLKSSDLKPVDINKQSIQDILKLGRKKQELLHPRQKKALMKIKERFQAQGKNLMVIVEKDIRQLEEAAKRFDKMTEEEQAVFFQPSLTGAECQN